MKKPNFCNYSASSKRSKNMTIKWVTRWKKPSKSKKRYWGKNNSRRLVHCSREFRGIETNSWSIDKSIRRDLFKGIKICCWICWISKTWRPGEPTSSWELRLERGHQPDPSISSQSSTTTSRRLNWISQLDSKTIQIWVATRLLLVVPDPNKQPSQQVKTTTVPKPQRTVSFHQFLTNTYLFVVTR